MLVELRIRNVAVIDRVDLPLSAGLNVLSGETGAGKSLIVGALGLLLGDRAAVDRVRAGAERASVEGIFEVTDAEGLNEIVDGKGIELDDNTLVLKREVNVNGRSRAWINSSPVTIGVLSEVGALLVSVHGQHDGRQLLEADHQRDLLDDFAGAAAVRQSVSECHRALAGLRKREQDMLMHQREARKRADYLRFVVREIDEISPKREELETIDVDISRLTHAEDLQRFAADAASRINGDNDSAIGQLGSVSRGLTQLARIDPTTEKWQSIVDGAVYALEDLSRELDDYATSVDVDPIHLARLEERRHALTTLTRKYGPTLDDVLVEHSKAAEELEFVDNVSSDLQALSVSIADAERRLVEAAAELTLMRSTSAQRFAESVTKLLPELGMPDGRFSVQLTPLDAVGVNGAEAVVFEASLNAGGESRPLARIASGGELARLMLALSTVLSRLQRVPTLVFDEVDAGVGGAVAWQVGELMRRVAGHHQVIAISHLAQIAATAHHHLLVRKSAVGTVTSADTKLLSDDDRVGEIARMLSGDAEREVSRAHARELLDRGRSSETTQFSASARAKKKSGRSARAS